MAPRHRTGRRNGKVMKVESNKGKQVAEELVYHEFINRTTILPVTGQKSLGFVEHSAAPFPLPPADPFPLHPAACRASRRRFFPTLISIARSTGVPSVTPRTSHSCVYPSRLHFVQRFRAAFGANATGRRVWYSVSVCTICTRSKEETPPRPSVSTPTSPSPVQKLRFDPLAPPATAQSNEALGSLWHGGGGYEYERASALSLARGSKAPLRLVWMLDQQFDLWRKLDASSTVRHLRGMDQDA
ncbi:hypothetical protein KSP39_PZI002106 [Platanthera zijinensis]|uniref:Uncharacterized protein n=1 Tax=Platanthera zijinensis TaxID=2320716 RepID=A0AAP0BYJ3_9ASPA